MVAVMMMMMMMMINVIIVINNNNNSIIIYKKKNQIQCACEYTLSFIYQGFPSAISTSCSFVGGAVRKRA